MSRPSDIDRPSPSHEGKTVGEGILADVRAGLFIKVAAARNGVTAGTVHEWVRRGEGRDERAPDERFEAFAVAIARAKADAEARAIALIQAAGAQDWRAAAWFLERTRPKDYGRHLVEHSGAEGGSVHLEVNSESIEAVISNPDLVKELRRRSFAADLAEPPLEEPEPVEEEPVPEPQEEPVPEPAPKPVAIAGRDRFRFGRVR